jgi:trk system potassium uptake protein TrkA
MSRQFAVIGLGRLGTSMVRTLDSLGHQVLGMDSDARLVQEVADDLPNVHLVAADATDEDVLRDLNLEQFDAAAVVIGENVEAGILATATLKELGVPMVVARAVSPIHARVLTKVGADRVIQPERDMGEQLARTLASPAVLDHIELGDDEALVEVEVPNEWVGRTLRDLELGRKRGLSVVTLKHAGSGSTIPRGDTTLEEGDVMLIAGPKKRLSGFEPLRG